MNGTREPDVSIVIRAKNEAARIGQCLRGIKAQDYSGRVEILVVDSGSTDWTTRIVRQFNGVQLIEIRPAEFNYGRTLNLGIRAVTGEYVVALSAHCVPVDRGWLRALTAPMVKGERIVGTFGRQVPWPGCEPMEVSELIHAFPDRDYICQGPPPSSSMDVVYSNANACFRRKVALSHPFPELAWAEDRVWAHAMLDAGHAIGYAAAATVYHSHFRSLRDYFRIGANIGRTNSKLARRPFHLRNERWFGLRKLYWTWCRLYDQSGPSTQTRGKVDAARMLAAEIALALGTARGERTAVWESKRITRRESVKGDTA